ncbi:MAG: helix-turn-helix domain-containing protein [Ignavibacteria bacterium]|jgi:transcriptional regulator with XRE-family HTH domain|nr:helix-turn-helix domain-containing protein [Ignavibacteria bacterium]
MTKLSEIIGQKIKGVRQKNGLTQKKFAEALETSSSYISEIESGLKIPGGEFLYKLARVFNEDINVILSDIEELKEKARNLEQKKEYPVEAQVWAGFGEMYSTVEWSEKEAIIDFPMEGYVWVRISGDSMAPFLQRGDLALITDRLRIRPGDLVAARILGDGGVLKIYDSEVNGNVVLTSFNPAHKPLILDKTKVTLYKVVLVKKE